MLLKLWAIENRKIYRRLAIWVILFLFAGMAGTAYLLLGFTPSTQGSVLLPEALNHSRVLSLTIGSSLGGLFFVVLVGMSTAQEYNWGTFNLLLTRGVPRPALLAVKFLVLLFPALLIALVPQIGAALVSLAFTASLRGSLGALGQVNWGLALESIGLATYTLLPYGALAFLIAILTRSPIIAIAGGAGFGMIGEGILLRLLLHLGGGFEQIVFYSPFGLSQGLLALLDGQSGAGLLSPAASAVGIAAYTLAFLGLAVWLFRRQDLSSGS